ncbi:MAG: DUF4252 domain-containing protein [Bacteroidota bacterium]
MKNKEIYPLIYLILATFYIALGQNPGDIYAYYEDLAESDACGNCTSIYVSPKMFSLFSKNVEGNDDEGLSEAISRMTGLRLLHVKEVPNDFLSDGDTAQFYANTFRNARELTRVGREELMYYKNGKEQTRFYVTYTDDSERIAELVMLSYSPIGFTLLTVTGDLKLEQIASLTDAMDIEVEGLEEVK